MGTNRLRLAGLATLLAAGCTSPNPRGSEAPKLWASPTANLTTAETGLDTTFTVTLTEKPSAQVILRPYSDNPREGAVASAELDFGPDDWNIAHVVTVHGVDDPDRDGNQLFHIAFGDSESSDTRFAGLHVDPVAIATGLGVQATVVPLVRLTARVSVTLELRYVVSPP